MNNYVLFSPLGLSDPSRGCRDGAFIHICRLYRPKKVYIYMSKEICGFDKQDNRYEVYLTKLCEKLAFECEIVRIKRPDLINVHEFDAFYADFTTIINQVIEENADCEVLLNLSSGTPQMKSALKIIDSLSFKPLIPIQVATPVKKSNHEMPVDEKYDIDLEWELNEDNYDVTYENRCTVTDSQNLNARIKYEIIAKHVIVYDYKAALTVALTIRDFIDPRMINLIKAGEQRLMLGIGNAEMSARSSGYDLLPLNGRIYSDKAKICFEYILGLKIKLMKNELADFVRAVSPLLTDMFELYLENKCAISITDYYLYDKKNRKTPKLSRNLLPIDLLGILDNYFAGFGGYKDTEPCAANLCLFVKEKGNSEAAEIATKLRLFEQDARNIAAHEIVTVTDKWLKNRAGFEASEILKMLQNFLSLSVPIPKDAWNSYDKLNEAILEMPLRK